MGTSDTRKSTRNRIHSTPFLNFSSASCSVEEFRMVLAVVRSPVHTVLPSHRKIAAYLRSIRVVFALALFRVVPDARAVKLPVGRWYVTGYVGEQFVPECFGKLSPGWFGWLAGIGVLILRFGDVTWVTHVQTANTAVIAVRYCGKSLGGARRHLSR